MNSRTKKVFITCIIWSLFFSANVFAMPQPPQSLRAETSVVPVFIRLQWEIAADETAEISVYRSTSSRVLGERLTTQVSEGWYVDDTVQLGTSYYYRVQTSDASGISALSEPVSARIDVPVPSSVRAHDTAEGGTIRITWQRPTLELPLEYAIYRSTRAGQDGSRIARQIAGTEYTDRTANNKQQYYYRVRAIYNGRIESPSSAAVSAVATDHGAPMPPHDLRARTSNNGNVSLSWSAERNADIDYFIVYRSHSPSDALQRAHTKHGSYLDEHLSDGVTYYYRVAAVDASGNSSFASDALAVMAVNEDVRRLAITEPKAYATGRDGEIRLSWNTTISTHIIKTTIYRSFSSGDIGQKINENVRATSFVDRGLQNGVQYYYVVRIEDQSGQRSAQSTVVDAAPYVARAKGIPPAVRSFIARDNADAASLTLSWENPPGFAYSFINIYRSTSVDERGELLFSAIRANTVIDANNTQIDTQYIYTIVTIDASGAQSIPVRTAGMSSMAIAGERADEDSDGDGLVNQWERTYGFHPYKPDSRASDYDNDGLSLIDEQRYETHPWNEDTDGDGYPDGLEVDNEYSPRGAGRLLRQSTVSASINTTQTRYGVARIPLDEEKHQAQILHDALNQEFNGVFALSRAQWPAFVNAYLYGGYRIDELAHTIANGPGLVHPSIPAEAWRQSSEYARVRAATH